MIRPDVFQHADRHYRIELPADVAIVVFDELDAIVEPFRAGPPAGVLDLLVRNVVGMHRDAVMPRHVQRKLPQPQPISTTRSPGRSQSLRQTCSILANCAASSEVVGVAKYAQV